MNEELEVKLVKRHPDLFTDYYGDPMKTCMAWGMEHGDGWYSLIESLCEFIDYNIKRGIVIDITNATSDEGDVEKDFSNNIIRSRMTGRRVLKIKPRVHFEQIKEKFGSLRIYLSINISHDDQTAVDHYKVNDELNAEFDTFSEVINRMQSFIERKSEQVCESCGQPGQLYSTGWWKTLCPVHAQKAGRIGNDLSATELIQNSN